MSTGNITEERTLRHTLYSKHGVITLRHRMTDEFVAVMQHLDKIHVGADELDDLILCLQELKDAIETE